jgi:4'-phosphopantetheinyl transferase
LQFLASRLLLKYLEPDFPFEKVMTGTGGKPFLPGGEFYFSISHCGDYAAAIISKKSDVGIDVELINPKATKLNTKFLSETERALFKNKTDPAGINRQSTLCWSIKETMFKWYGKGGVDFKKPPGNHRTSRNRQRACESII